MTKKAAYLGAADDNRLWLIAILGIAALGITLDLLGYWPGVMIDDARWQYQQAVDNAFEDWHPPAMAWIWRRLIGLMPGPGPMLILQLSLYWAGFALIGAWAWHRGRPGTGLALAAVGWIPAPLALMGTVVKDGLMAGSLVTAVGLLLWHETTHGRHARRCLLIGTLAAIGLAAALRFNAFLACTPLVVAAVPRPWIKTKLRLVAVGVGATLMLLAIMPAINVLLEAQKTNVGSSLIIFDLGGITENSGINQFPDMGVPDPVAANHQCYDPHQWDGYSEWAAKPCPLDFDRFQSTIARDHLSPTTLWLRAIATHPIAYARHRLAHFNVSTWFIVPKGPGAPGWDKSVDNPWGFRVTPNTVLHAVSLVAAGASRTPLGWPICWMAIALAAFILSASARLPITIRALAASAFLFGLGYAVFGVATGMRYHLWTISGAALAGVLTIGEIVRAGPRKEAANRANDSAAGARDLLFGGARDTDDGGLPSRPVLLLAAAIVVVPCLIAITARFVLR